MANVMEAKVAEMQKELEMRRREHEEDLTALNNCRAQMKVLEERNRRLERCIVQMVLESYGEGH